ncbi:hypothetical protein ACFWIA_05085 [Streptomyces sp. NPDC127068]|uniref:hypothetical protein n=1 Tax=Streptomyces sp. NPDC127068 TaxID=3347127 RepID=UPI003667C080
MTNPGAARRPAAFRAAVATLLLAGAALALTPPQTARADSREDDLHRVYCLADDRRSDVAEAAVRLGVATAVPGAAEELRTGPGADGEVTVAQWADRQPDDFRRVCRTVMAARGDAPDKGGGDSPGALGTGLLLAAVAAAFTLLGSAVERGATYRRQRDEALAAAVHAYSYAAESYLAGWQTGAATPHEEVARCRAELATALRGLRDTGSRRRHAQRLAVELPLSDAPATSVRAGAGGFHPLGAQELRAEATRQRGLLADAVAGVEGVNASFAVWHLRRTGRGALRLWSAGTRALRRRWGRSEGGGDGR